MNNTVFTLAEKNLMVIYNTGSRLNLMAELGNMLNCLSPDATELYDLTVSVIKKLDGISDSEFAALEMYNDDMKGW